MPNDELDESLLDDETGDQEELEIDIEDVPEQEVPAGVTSLQLVKFTPVVSGKQTRIKATFTAASNYDNISNLFHSKEQQVRLCEPPRDIPRPATEIFGTLMDYTDVCRGKQRVVVNIEFELSETVLDALKVISFTSPTTMWMNETQMELPLDATENGR